MKRRNNNPTINWGPAKQELQQHNLDKSELHWRSGGAQTTESHIIHDWTIALDNLLAVVAVCVAAALLQLECSSTNLLEHPVHKKHITKTGLMLYSWSQHSPCVEIVSTIYTITTVRFLSLVHLVSPHQPTSVAKCSWSSRTPPHHGSRSLSNSTVHTPANRN